MSASVISLMNQARLTSGGPTTSTPVQVGKTGIGSERFAAGRPCRLLTNRDNDGAAPAAPEGTITVYGVNLPHPDTGAAASVQVFKGEDGATGRTVFTSALVYAAFSNYNFIVIQNGTVLAQGAGAGKYQISDSSGVAVITLGTAAAVSDRLEVYKVTPAEVLADGAHSFNDSEIIAKQVMWVLGTHDGSSADFSKTSVRLVPSV